ncbi:DUF934 domain-containing protein [Chachezhania sediminis]|uniref:DUF934 domain-containing protein n=1 Tax=Chachezhania sediminis TaxID=2599291 RepID=UPI00131D3FBB|nr:DUF934 domain-containing protein [Chachezhania sediminis]
MSVIVTDAGFGPDDWTHGYEPAAEGPARAIDVASDTDPDTVPLGQEIEMIRVAFPAFSDGRGFTIARQLRRRGFAGRLRAAGHILSDQYAMARRSGFDEVEIDEALAQRQPEAEWQFRADWQDHDYRARLR